MTLASRGSSLFRFPSPNHYSMTTQQQSSSNSYRVLITGGCGFIGSHVAETFLRSGHYVIIVDDMNRDNSYDLRFQYYNLSILKSCYSSERLAYYCCNVTNQDEMKNIFELEKPTHVCHLAVNVGNSSKSIETNIEGTTCLLNLSKDYHIQNFIYASSYPVHGNCENINQVSKKDEVMKQPVSLSTATKASCELLAETYYNSYGLHSIGLRFCTVYGPRGRPDMVAFKFIDHIVRGVPIQQYGDGSALRDYTYISDIVDGIVLALDRPLGCEIINLGSGNSCSSKDFIKLVEKTVGKKAIIEYLPKQPGDVRSACVDLTKAHTLINYRSKVLLEDGIAQTFDWYKFFYSTIYPGGHVGSQASVAPNPFASVYSPSPPKTSQTEFRDKPATTNPRRERVWIPCQSQTLTKLNQVGWSLRETKVRLTVRTSQSFENDPPAGNMIAATA